MKKLVTILVIVAVLITGVFLAKDIAARKILTKGVRTATGLKFKVGDVNLGILGSYIGVKDLKMYNPAGFEEGLMADIPEIYINIVPSGFFKNIIHLKEVRLNLKKIVIVKNSEGKINVKSLKPIKEEEEGEEKEPRKETNFKVDILHLKIGKVVYEDYSKGSPPKIKEYNINIDKKYENLTSLDQIIKLVVFKAVVDSALTDVIDVKGLSSDVSKALKGTTKSIEKGTKKKIEEAAEGIKKIFGGDKE